MDCPELRTRTLENDNVDDAHPGNTSVNDDSIDKISVVDVLGFTIVGLHNEDSILMQRQFDEFNNRPVYEDESGAMFLYFALSGRFSSPESLEEACWPPADADVLLHQEGHWVVARQARAGIDDDCCLAFVRDSAVTPHFIDPSNPWYVPAPSSLIGTRHFVPNDGMKLEISQKLDEAYFGPQSSNEMEM